MYIYIHIYIYSPIEPIEPTTPPHTVGRCAHPHALGTGSLRSQRGGVTVYTMYTVYTVHRVYTVCTVYTLHMGGVWVGIWRAYEGYMDVYGGMGVYESIWGYMNAYGGI